MGNVAELEPAWAVDTGERSPAGPVTAGGAVVVIDGDSVQADEAATGAARWDTPLPEIEGALGPRSWTGPSARGATVFAGYGNPLTSGGSSGGIAAFDAATGAVTGGDVCCGPSATPTSPVSFVGREVWFGVGLVTAFPPDGYAGVEGRLADRRVVRSLTIVGGTGTVASAPAVAGGVAYFSRPGGGFLDAIDATGVEGCSELERRVAAGLRGRWVRGGDVLAGVERGHAESAERRDRGQRPGVRHDDDRRPRRLRAACRRALTGRSA